jgi:short-subunit dehydrogenase
MRGYDTALITGASSGLGEEFARQLATRCRRLVLVARRGERLQRLAEELQAIRPGIEVRTMVFDLKEHAQRLELVEDLLSSGTVPDLLVNNAGLGDYGSFATSEWERIDAMLTVNIDALTHLSHALLPPMVEMGRGAIINVSSLASTLPIPDFAVYAATKAYVTSLSEALRLELRGTGIPVLAVCPGPVRTEFGRTANRDPDSEVMVGTRKWFFVPKEQVVGESLEALERDRARLFPGWKVAALAALIGILPMIAIRAAVKRHR